MTPASPITVSTEIDRPAADVFAYATDPSRFPEWQQGVVVVRREARKEMPANLEALKRRLETP